MSAALAAIVLPLLAAPVLALVGAPRQGAQANLALNAVVFLLTMLAADSPGGGLVHADGLGIVFGIVSGFVGLTTAINNLGFVRAELDRMSRRSWRMHHAACQTLLGATLLGLYADNIGLLWLAVEVATIAATLGVGLPRTASALAAAWQYFILGGVGIALALFGTLLVYLAAQPALGPGLAALSFSGLNAGAARLDGALLTLAFVFLLFGYGTKAALVPLHGWLPDADAEGPAPLTALGGLMMNVALVAILRFRHLLQDNAGAHGGAMPPGRLLLALGLASLLLAAFSLWRRGDVRRFFGFSSIGTAGLVVFAFGIGGPAAIFAGLLQMLLQGLIKPALLQALTVSAILRGGAAPGEFGFSRLRGMLHTNRNLGWALGCCIFALTGLPPSGLFTPEFLIVSRTIQAAPVLSLPLGAGLLLGAITMMRQIGFLLLAAPPAGTRTQPAGWTTGVIWLQLGVMTILAFAMPAAVLHTLSNMAVTLQ